MAGVLALTLAPIAAFSKEKLIDSAKLPELKPPNELSSYIIPSRADADSAVFPSGTSVQAWLQSIVDKLRKQWPHDSPPVKVYVSSKFFPNADYMAAAGPDNAIVVDLGVVEKSVSDDEVAFILGHELSHILLGHIQKDEVVKGMNEGTSAALHLGQMAGTMAAVQSNGNTLNVDQTEAAKNQKTAGKVYVGLQSVVNDLYAPQWSRNNEDQADELGVDLMIKAGYAPRYTSLVFQHLADSETAFQNHFEDVTKSYETLVKKVPPEQLIGKFAQMAGDQQQNKSFLETLKKKVIHDLIGAAVKTVQDRLRKSHRDPEDREKSLVKYIEKTNDDSKAIMARKPTLDGVNAVKASVDFKTLLAAREAIIDAQADLGDDDPNKALTALGPALQPAHASAAQRRAFGAYSEGRLVKQQIRLKQGQMGDAIQNLLLAQHGGEAGAQVYEKLFELEWNSGGKKLAEADVDRAETKFGDKVHFLPERIFAAAQSGKGADDLLIKCLQSEKDYIHEVCVAARYAPDASFRDNYAEIYCGIAQKKLKEKPLAAPAPKPDSKEGADKKEETGGVAGFFKGVGNSVGGLFSGSDIKISFDDCKT